MSNEQMILALDQGTSNTKAILVDRAGNVRSHASRAVDIAYPRPTWVEQDGEQIWRSVRQSIEQCLASAGSGSVAVVGISNQRESAIAWDRATGKPIGPVVSWQCHRSADICDSLRERDLADDIRQRTGLPIDPMFTASKIRWLLDATPDGQRRAEAGEICVGTIDSWLLWNLTGGAQHRTDVSNASRTQLLDISAASWDPVLLGTFGIPVAALPEVRPSSGIFGETTRVGRLPAGVPIGALIGDSHAALFGQAGFAPGSVKATYGTGSSLMTPTQGRVRSERGLAATIAWGLDSTVYALEGNIYSTGAAVQWMADLIGLDGPDEVAALAESAPGTEGVYLVPAFAGLGAPHWDDQARGLLSGLTQSSTRPHMARAVIDSIAYQVRDVFDAMQAATGGTLQVLLADGGVTRNRQLLQFQADILDVPVLRNDLAEVSALGAAYLAGLTAGVWSSLGEIEALPRSSDRFEPSLGATERARLYAGWSDAVARATYRP